MKRIMTMNYCLITAALTMLCTWTLVGCGEPKPEKTFKFGLGEEVGIKVNDKPAIVVEQWDKWSREDYRIRYSNDLGELEWEDVQEYEIEKR